MTTTYTTAQSTLDAMRDGDLLARRRRTLGTHSPLFYDEPLEIVSGSGVWLTDAAGRQYLDVYNNVPHVGHANPVVAEAISAQLRELVLNTRYLNERIVAYAEELLSHFSAPLDRVSFTNSGSEANELALRMARQHTGNTGVLVSDFSYHGNTSSLAVLTTGLQVLEPLGDHVRALTIPDTQGLSGTDEAAMLQQALEEVDAAIASLANAGHGVSALLFDPLFSTEGLPRTPKGYVEGLVARVQAAGGLVIADEVQSGFGRDGETMWGHQAYDITPDIVVLGKPMGNGHPIGAVVTSLDLLEEFGSRNLYFNTFAGNPVSAAAGLAVLRVMRDENLLTRAREVGLHVAENLRQATRALPQVRAVRGRGLFIGVEVIEPTAGDPDPTFAKRLIEDMRRRGVLVSRVGRHDNVLKIRPPLVLTHEEADVLLERLTESLDSLNKSKKQ
ncbi:aspartate aminotransferase family protein [Streptomyces acidicola]|uniref:aspartate aminotransferase family protein n=1 Tax=Streptomyces acidicola TaxID=2596892 RepID=UPI0037F16A37